MEGNTLHMLDNSDIISSGNDTSVPLAKCPICFGDCYMTDIEFICHDCLSLFKVPSTAVDNANNVYRVDPRKIDIGLFSNKSPLEENDDPDSVTISIRGEVFDHLKKIQQKYDIGSITDTAIVFLLTMLNVSDMLEKSNSKSVCFVNESGSKSDNLMNGGIYDRVKKIIDKRQKDAKIVDEFIDHIARKMRVDEARKMYGSIDKNHDKWNFSKESGGKDD